MSPSLREVLWPGGVNSPRERLHVSDGFGQRHSKALGQQETQQRRQSHQTSHEDVRQRYGIASCGSTSEEERVRNNLGYRGNRRAARNKRDKRWSCERLWNKVWFKTNPLNPGQCTQVPPTCVLTQPAFCFSSGLIGSCRNQRLVSIVEELVLSALDPDDWIHNHVLKHISSYYSDKWPFLNKTFYGNIQTQSL